MCATLPGQRRTVWIKAVDDSGALFEETWRERHMQPGDRATPEREFLALKDAELQYYCRYLLRRYQEHQAIDARRRSTTRK